MIIRQVLAKKSDQQLQSVRRTATLQQAAQMLVQHRIGALVVTDVSGQLVGIMSERDLVPIVANCGSDAREFLVEDVMTSTVITCGRDDDVGQVLRTMNDNGIRHIPVVEHDIPMAMISIRELTTAFELLQIEANTDPLTRLSNRRPFLAALASEFVNARESNNPLSVAMLDIDHFKQVNDTYGHLAGDSVLRGLSDMLVDQFHDGNFVGRLGGEEFAVVLPEVDLIEAAALSQKFLLDIAAARFPGAAEGINVTVSIGIAQDTLDRPCGTAILKRADELLYVAKSSGRNRVVVEGADRAI